MLFSFDTLNSHIKLYITSIIIIVICFSLSGVIGSLFSFLQFLSTPIIGAASDVYGRRPLMLLCMVCVSECVSGSWGFLKMFSGANLSQSLSLSISQSPPLWFLWHRKNLDVQTFIFVHLFEQGEHRSAYIRMLCLHLQAVVLIYILYIYIS